MRSQYRWLFCTAAILAAGLAAGVADVASAQQNKPNILVIWGDDVGQSNISGLHPRCDGVQDSKH